MKKYIYSVLMAAMSVFTFSSCEDVPAPYDMPNQPETPETPSVDPAGTGTKDDPFNVAGAVKYIENGGSEETEVYVKGKVVSVKSGSYDASYGSLKYYISDDGTSANQFYVFNGYAGPNRTKFSGEDALKAGDEVVICGKLVNYSGTQEFTTGNYVVTLNGKSMSGTDTPEIPSEGYINETFAKDFGSFTLKNVKGTPWVIDSSYGYAKATGYDNASKTTTESESYIVSKAIDLSASKSASLQFSYVLRYVTKNGSAIEGVKNQVLITDNYTGDPTTTNWTDITGTLVEGTDWKTWQTYSHNLSAYTGKKNIVIALHYACAASSGTWEVKELSVKEGGSSTPETPDTPGTSGNISIDGLTVTLNNSEATAGESFKVEDLSTLNLESKIETIKLGDGTVITVDQNGGKNPPAYNANYKEIRLYANNKMTITTNKNIAKIILTCSHDSQKGDCIGNTTATASISGNTATYTNVYTEPTGGGTQLRIKAIEIIYAK